MTMAVPMPQRDVVPPCFGQEWDPKEPECSGGPDPNFQAADGGHIRPQCAVFARCGARTQALKQARATGTNVVPATSLVRPAVITPPPAQQPPKTFADYIARQAAQANPNASWVERQRLEAMTSPRPPMQVPVPSGAVSPTFSQHYPMAAHSPATRYELNYTMPGYLTIPEERGQGEGLLAVLFREIIRAIFKAVGHTVAHSFDTRPLKDPTQHK